MSDARLAGLAESAAQGIERQEWMAPVETRVRDGFVEVRRRPEAGLAAA